MLEQGTGRNVYPLKPAGRGVGVGELFRRVGFPDHWKQRKLSRDKITDWLKSLSLNAADLAQEKRSSEMDFGSKNR